MWIAYFCNIVHKAYFLLYIQKINDNRNKRKIFTKKQRQYIHCNR